MAKPARRKKRGRKRAAVLRHEARARAALEKDLDDPGAERWGDLESAVLDAIGWLSEVAHGVKKGLRPDPKAVEQRRDALLALADEIQDERHERGFCAGPGDCAACDVEAEE